MSNKKPKRDVWVPRPVIVMIGKTEYTIEPQPMRRYLEFEGRLRELLGGFMPLGLGGEGEVGPPGDEGEDGVPAEEVAAEVAEEAVAKGIVERGVETVHAILECVIPDLDYEDVLDAPEPQLEHAIQVCLKINGGRWAETLIREFFTPLLPALQALLTQWLLSRAGEPTPTEAGESPQISS